MIAKINQVPLDNSMDDSVIDNIESLGMSVQTKNDAASNDDNTEYLKDLSEYIDIEELEDIDEAKHFVKIKKDAHKKAIKQKLAPKKSNQQDGSKQLVEHNSQAAAQDTNAVNASNDSDQTNSATRSNHYALVTTQDIGSFEKYVQTANTAPKLSSEEEWDLANRIHKHNDLEAAQKLVFSNLRYVIAIAQSYSGYGLPMPDLVQEGNVGLMRAIKRFDPEKKVKLMSFASHWVRAEIHEFIIKNWRIIKMATTKAQRKLFFKLRSSRKNLDWLGKDEAQSIAEKLDVKVSEVYQMEGRMSHTDTTFDVSKDDNETSLVPAQYLSDTRYSPEKIVLESNNFEFQKQRMIDAIQKLDQRSQEIIHARWLSGNKITLKELSTKYQVSLERIRQIEALALKKLKDSIEEI